MPSSFNFPSIEERFAVFWHIFSGDVFKNFFLAFFGNYRGVNWPMKDGFDSRCRKTAKGSDVVLIIASKSP